jgi:hypothetical protein
MVASSEIRRLMTLLEDTNDNGIKAAAQPIDKIKIEKLFLKFFDTNGTYTIDDQGKISVTGYAQLKHKSRDGKLPVQFSTVTKDFYCADGDLTTLLGSPKNVGGTFHCNGNKDLRSLEFSPATVKRGFYCNSCQLDSIVGSPRKMKMFNCRDNNLTSLRGCPEVEELCIRGNPLTSLEGLCISNKLRFFTLDWTPELPLLRLLMLKHSAFGDLDERSEVENILDKYRSANISRSNILACQKELIDAGFEGNASW